MSSSRRRNTNPSTTTSSTHPNETSTPPTETTVWLDEFKKCYKRWKFLMHKTGITVYPDTSMIYASDTWWKEQELGCKLTKSLNQRPPEFWNVMQRCFVLYDVQSQSQHSARQRREQLINEHPIDEDERKKRAKMTQTLIVVTCLKHKFLRRKKKKKCNVLQLMMMKRRLNLQSTARRGSSSQRSGRSARVSIGSGSRGNRRRQSFETTIQDTIAGYREFQRQSFQQLRPGGFDQDDYDEFKKAEAIFIALDLPKHTRFWACINALKELVFWRKYFIDISGSSNEDKLQLLEAMTGWGTPPNAPQWGTPPNAPQWGTPPNAPQWDTPPNFQQSGSSGTTPANVQYGFSLGGQGEHMRNTQQASPSGLGFTNYFETGKMPQTPRPGGFFNIWGTRQEPNASHQSDVGDED
ncbi:hypothetical protein ARALYDRAFT_323064 [Arabidopsis lyrata subsp. lyrata]|uniref:Myb/SANT-like domain-containing protein n=1 Tax=Arabidopsis lyrata subsp. lyrata TaxID=81972 RepID=D7LPC5_ARALL|nr:hypothetical protein ARALYDRAFT_323064 [Arabidopsis lyrata subsp. lyrata]